VVVHRKVPLQATAHHLRAWRYGIHSKNRKLRLAQPPHHIASPATSFQSGDVIRCAIRCSRTESIPQRLQVLERISR
jgi:hypothetical protein